MENSVAVCGEPVESMPHVSHARVFARDSQLTTDPRPQFAPQWSPDGKQIAFTASERGNRELRVILAEGGRFGRSHPIRPRSSGRVGRQMAAKSPSSLGGPATPTSGFSGPRVANLGNSLWTPPTISYPCLVTRWSVDRVHVDAGRRYPPSLADTASRWRCRTLQRRTGIQGTALAGRQDVLLHSPGGAR